MSDNKDNSSKNNKDNKLYKNLVIFLKIFRNRPNHLAKYLIDNLALDDNFIESISNSEKLNKIDPNEPYSYFSDSVKIETPYFSNFEEMNEYYNEMMIQDLKLLQDPEKIKEEINQKLSESIENEEYEEAARIRDYMRRNNIDKI
jgi:hypothetical protein